MPPLWASRFRLSLPGFQVPYLLLMIEILHDLICQKHGNYGNIVHIRSCRISIINRTSRCKNNNNTQVLDAQDGSEMGKLKDLA